MPRKYPSVIIEGLKNLVQECTLYFNNIFLKYKRNLLESKKQSNESSGIITIQTLKRTGVLTSKYNTFSKGNLTKQQYKYLSS